MVASSIIIIIINPKLILKNIASSQINNYNGSNRHRKSSSNASIRRWIIVMKRSLLIKSILEVPWVHCNGLYEMNTCSYGSFIKVVTFMRAFCNLIVKSRESKVYKKQNSS